MTDAILELESSAVPVDILDETDPRFSGLHTTRDRIGHDLQAVGIGAQVQHTEVISIEEEEQLWQTGLLNVISPKGLLNAVFFANRKNLCLCGGIDHRQLKILQFRFDHDER